MRKNLIKEHCLNKTLEPQEGFFWGSQQPVSDGEYEDLYDLTILMEDLISNGWTIGYCGDW